MTLIQRSAIKGLYITTALAALSMAACNKTPAAATPPPLADAGPAPLPLDTGVPPVPAAAAPAAYALPPAPPARVSARRDRSRYDYVSRAADINGAFAGSPPDYAIDYGGERPTYWRSTSGAYRVVENTPDGERYYYYDPGAAEPFLVRDGGYSYGYDQGQLAVVYDQYGRPLPDTLYDAQAERAGRYLVRARALYDASQQRQHEAAYAANWDRNRGEIQAQQQQWEDQQQRDADWRAWNDSRTQDQNAWRREADRRRALDQQRPPQGGSYGSGPSAPGYNPNPYGYGAVQARSPARVQPALSPPPVVVVAPYTGPVNDPLAMARAQQAQQDASRLRQLQQQDQVRAQQAQLAQAQQAQAQAQQKAQQVRSQDQARVQQAQIDAAHQRQLQDQARVRQAQAAAALATQRTQQLQAQERAQQTRMEAQARIQQAQAEAAHQRQLQQQDQARAQQAQAVAVREAQRTQQLQAQEKAQQARAQEQARVQQAQAEAARQHQQQVQAQAQARAAEAKVAEAKAAEARAAAAKAAAAKAAAAKAPANRRPADHPQQDHQSAAGGSPNPQQ